MKIIIVGGTGTIGRAVAKELGHRHEIIIAASRKCDVIVDITKKESIEKMFQTVSDVDAVIAATGKVHFDELSCMTDESYQIGLNDKLMGQVNLVLIGSRYINDYGVFTLTSGILSHDPIRFGSSASMVNAALEGFTRAAALEMPRGLRINVVSPTVITESLHNYVDYFRGFESVPAARVALAFSKSVEGAQTGRVYHVQ